jgi:hypothetical protein
MTNWDWKTKLKTNKTSIKGLRKTIRKKIKTEVEMQTTKRTKL